MCLHSLWWTWINTRCIFIPSQFSNLAIMFAYFFIFSNTSAIFPNRFWKESLSSVWAGAVWFFISCTLTGGAGSYLCFLCNVKHELELLRHSQVFLRRLLRETERDRGRGRHIAMTHVCATWPNRSRKSSYHGFRDLRHNAPLDPPTSGQKQQKQQKQGQNILYAFSQPSSLWRGQCVPLVSPDRCLQFIWSTKMSRKKQNINRCSYFLEYNPVYMPGIPVCICYLQALAKAVLTVLIKSGITRYVYVLQHHPQSYLKMVL